VFAGVQLTGIRGRVEGHALILTICSRNACTRASLRQPPGCPKGGGGIGTRASRAGAALSLVTKYMEDFCMPEQTTMPMKREDTAPRRWDPFDMFETLQEEMDRFWRRPSPFWAGAVPSFFRRGGGQGMAWAPRMDVYEKDNNLIVKADLPGLKNEDVQVELDDGGLVIRGTAKPRVRRRKRTITVWSAASAPSIAGCHYRSRSSPTRSGPR
jgi:hypothetical protein